MRINLKTNFSDRFKVKALGARWDVARKVWYIVNVEDLTPFMPYIESAKQSPKPPTTPRDSRLWAKTGPKVFESCGCDVLPWEDCWHTEVAAQTAMREMLSP